MIDPEEDPRMSHRGRVRQLPGQREGLLTAPQGLIRIAQQPQGQGRMAQAADARVMAAVEKSVRAMLVRVIQSDALLQMGLARDQIAGVQVGRTQRVMSLKEE